MASDDQELLAKISQLAGQINRHKNALNIDQQLQSNPSTRGYGGNQQPSTGWRQSRGGYPSRGYSRGGRAPQVHRNRTLVLNGNTSTPGAGEAGVNENEKPSANENNATPGWVTKQDRHLQLINTSIFEKDSLNRAKAMEQTRQQKLKQRDDREKTRFVKHLQRAAGNKYNASVKRAAGTTSNHEVEVNGIYFRVAQNGSKLVKVPGDLNAAKSTPKSALIGGVRFHRSKSGNMYRAGIIKAHRRTGVVKKIDEPCKMFTTTGNPFILK